MPAQAKIVYTPTNVKISFDQIYPLDLNHDGINDFSFYDHEECHSVACSAQLRVQRRAKNAVELNTLYFARALRAGVVIGPHAPFPSAAEPFMAKWFSISGTRSTFAGPWANGGKGVKNRYLGLKFHFKGGTHFGWARLSVSYHAGFVATLTGYAYETIPGKAIIAGATKGPDAAEPTAALSSHTPEPVTLGALALGAPGLSIWRRKESAAAALGAN